VNTVDDRSSRCGQAGEIGSTGGGIKDHKDRLRLSQNVDRREIEAHLLVTHDADRQDKRQD